MPDATTPTLYWVPGSRPSSVAEGVALLAVTGEPPPTGMAVNTKLSQGPPEVGAVADAAPWVGPVASAAVSVGAAGGGITKGMGTEAGVLPALLAPVTETSYVTLGLRLLIAQSAAKVQLVTIGVLPPIGMALNENEENGPPAVGALALRTAVKGVYGITEDMVGALQPNSAWCPLSARCSSSQFSITGSVR